MARFPCDIDGQRFPGRAFYFYPSLVTAGSRVGERMRICTHHADNVIRNLQEACEWDETLGVFNASDQDLCLICGKGQTLPDRFVYITCFPTRDERMDFWGLACASCGGPGPIFQAVLEPYTEATAAFKERKRPAGRPR